MLDKAIEEILDGVAPSKVKKKYKLSKEEYEQLRKLKPTLTTSPGEITYIGSSKKTIAELLEHSNYNLDEWEVTHSKVGSWQVPIKVGKGNLVKIVNLTKISVSLKKIIPDEVADAVKKFEKYLSLRPIIIGRHKRTGRKLKVKNGLLAEFCLYDAHFGKVCRESETGSEYNLQISKWIYLDAVQQLLQRTANEQISRIILPIGNDFFDVNDWCSQTVKGTRLESSDKYQHVFSSGLEAIAKSLDHLSDNINVPIEVLWVPGNHDFHSSWHLFKVLEALYRHHRKITITIGEKAHQYVKHGKVMLCLYHGDKIKEKDLPLFFATDNPVLWGESKWREAHIGHKHSKFKMRVVDHNEEMGFGIRRLEALCGTNVWHYENGFIGTRQSADVLIWNPDGYLHSEYPCYFHT